MKKSRTRLEQPRRTCWYELDKYLCTQDRISLRCCSAVQHALLRIEPPFLGLAYVYLVI